MKAQALRILGRRGMVSNSDFSALGQVFLADAESKGGTTHAEFKHGSIAKYTARVDDQIRLHISSRIRLESYSMSVISLTPCSAITLQLNLLFHAQRTDTDCYVRHEESFHVRRTTSFGALLNVFVSVAFIFLQLYFADVENYKRNQRAMLAKLRYTAVSAEI